MGLTGEPRRVRLLGGRPGVTTLLSLPPGIAAGRASTPPGQQLAHLPKTGVDEVLCVLDAALAGESPTSPEHRYEFGPSGRTG